MKLTEKICAMFARLRNAMDTKSTHFEIDERVDMSIMRNTEAVDRTKRVLQILDETLQNVKKERLNRVRSH